MATKIFVNLPIKDLNKSIEFFSKLGFTFNEQFTNDSSTCMIIGENIYVMLLEEKRFKDFIKKEIADTSKYTEAIICIDADSPEKVDEIVSKAIQAGGTSPNEKQDHGWMYGHGFEDLDGHLWEIIWMDMNAFPQQ